MASIHGLLDSRGKINVAAVAMLVWGALKFLRTLIRTTNRVWHSPTYSWWRLPLKSLALLGILMPAVDLSIKLCLRVRNLSEYGAGGDPEPHRRTA